MATNPLPHYYDVCKHIKRTQPSHTNLDEELVKQIALDYRTFPCFEKTLFEHLYIDHYSLERNELLKCRWKQYRDHIAERVFSPFQFPSNRDIHFYNGNVKFLPSESVHRFTSYRKRLKPGPGVDYRGQMPIPNELFLKRGIVEKEDSKTTVKKERSKKIDENYLKSQTKIEKK